MNEQMIREQRELMKMQFRMECLKLAVSGREGFGPRDIVSVAGIFYDYVTKASGEGQGAEGDRQPESHDAVGTGDAEQSLNAHLETLSGDLSGSIADPFSEEKN